MVTAVSVMPWASLPRVLPVQGHTTSTSSSPLGPMGSAPATVDTETIEAAVRGEQLQPLLLARR